MNCTNANAAAPALQLPHAVALVMSFDVTLYVVSWGWL
jgi:hypothetical protein